MFPPLTQFNLKECIDQNREQWGRRRTLWQNSDFIAVVHRGPTRGKQFHINEGEEIFHQLEGELQFHSIDASGRRQVTVLQPGEMFLLPPNVPHSPRRPDGSWTLVIERIRRPEEADRWVWFCEGCDNKVYEAPPRVGTGPADGGNSVIEETNKKLAADRRLSTCPRCGDILKID